MKTTIASTYDGILLSVLVNSEVSDAKGIVQIVHGMAEHKERYIPFIDFLSSNGYICVIHDHRGHGESVKSSKDLGYMYDGGYLALIDDCLTVNKMIREKYPDLPLFLFGHSMGSMVVRSFTKRFDKLIDGLIVCGSPSRNASAGAGRFLASLFPQRHRPAILQKMSFASFNKKFGKNTTANSWLCSDPAVVKAYNDDALCGFTFTANGFKNLFALMQDCYDTKGWAVANPSLPILFISGEEDPCMIDRAAFSESVAFMSERGYKNVNSTLYKGMRHEILNEIGKENTWKDILKFIEFHKSQNPNL